jgi:hypothetical protein
MSATETESKEVVKQARVRQPDGRLHKAAEYGTPRQRRLYVGLRRLSRLATDRDRRRLVGNGSAEPRFTVAQDQGFRIFGPGEVPGADGVIDAANALIAEHGKPEVSKGKHMRKRLLDPEALTPDSPFVRFAVSEPILSSVTEYLGVVPLLSYGDVWWSGYVEGELRNSQLYHCDSADTKQMKVFLFCNDIEESAGPLTVVEAAASEAAIDKLNYKFGDRASDDELRAAIPRDAEHPIVGPKGSVAFVDTSRCFHFGSRVTDRSKVRVLAMFQYITPTSFLLPRDITGSAPFRHLATDDESELARLVLGAA